MSGSISRVLAVAAFESRLARRMWRTWILAFFALLLPLGAAAQYAWLHRFISGLSGAASFVTGELYYTMPGFFLTLAMGLVGIFLVFDWRHRDESAHFAATLDSSGLSQLEQAWGKFLGLVSMLALPFVVLLVLQLAGEGLVVLIHRAQGSSVPFTWPHLDTLLASHLEIGFIGSLVPTAIAFGLAGATRSRWIAIVGAVAWLGAGFAVGFRLPERAAVLMGGVLELPTHSDFIGLDRDALPTLQTLARLLLVVLFVSLAALGPLGLPRNAAAAMRRIVVILGCAGLVALVVLAVDRVYVGSKSARLRVIEAEKKVAAAPQALVVRRDLDVTLEPSRGRLEGVASLRLRNPGSEALSELHFRLNAGLDVVSVASEGAPVSFERDLTVLTLRPAAALASGGEMPLEIRYEGRIDAASVDAEVALATAEIEPSFRVNARFLGSRAALLKRRCVALGTDAAWYPDAGVAFGHEFPEQRALSYAPGTLVVRAPDGWIPASAGRRSQEGGAWTFTTDVPVPGLSLNAARYEERTAEVAGRTVRLLFLPEHRANVDFFAEAADEIRRRGAERFEQAKARSGADYPHPELTFVEVPGSFAAHAAGWDAPNRMAAPGVVMLRESRFFLARFEYALKVARDRFKGGSGGGSVQVQVNGVPVTGQGGKPEEGETFSAVVAKADILQRFFATDWLGNDAERLAFRSSFDLRLQPDGPGEAVLGAGLPAYLAEVALDRTTFDHPDAIRVLNGPGMGEIIQANIQGRAAQVPDILVRNIADMDKVYELMQSRSLDDMKPLEVGRDFLGVMHLRGRLPLSALRDTIGTEAFAGAIGDLIAARAGGQYRWDDFRDAILARTPEAERADVEALLASWLTGTDLPGFIVEDARIQRLAGEQEAWQLLATVRNLGQGAGSAKLSAGKGADARWRLVEVGPGESVEAGLVLPVKAEQWQLQPYLSLNRQPPDGTARLLEGTSAEPPFEGARPVPETGRVRPVLVDNADSGFTVRLADGRDVAYSQRKADGKAFELDEAFPWQPRNEWGRMRSRQSVWYVPFGRFDGTAALRKVGEEDKGKPLACWRATLPEPGQWRVEAFLPSKPEKGGIGQNLAPKVAYTVSRDGQSDRIVLDVDQPDPRWADIGRFAFQREAEVCLEAEADGTVVADAVRFTKEQP